MANSFLELYRPDDYFGKSLIEGQNNFFTHFPEQERIFILAMLDACQEPKEMIATQGIEWIINRYTECNLVAFIIQQKIIELNKTLAARIKEKTERKPNEIPQNFEPSAVPSDYLRNLYLGSTAFGYAASRILIEQFGREREWKEGEEHGITWQIANENKRVKKGYQILEKVIKNTQNPIEFLVTLAKLVCEQDANPIKVLSHLLAIELKNEAIFSEIREVGAELWAEAPDLWNCYINLTPEQRKEAGILPIELVA